MSTDESSAFPARLQAAVRATLRPVYRHARRWYESALHARRRREAAERLQSRVIRRVLFVCEGNIYRSPYAAHLFQALLPPSLRPEFKVASAGFVGPGRPVPIEAQALAQAEGIDMSAHRSTLIVEHLRQEWDLFVVMDAIQQRRLRDRFRIPASRVVILGDLDPEPISERAIADPWRSPEVVLAPSYARVSRCVRELAQLLS
ncbi:MAG TPA: hypothetical protein VIL32_02430 [Steroidobacteraceae bacterium]